jgi:hypothetical protein
VRATLRTSSCTASFRFRAEFKQHIDPFDTEDAAFLWDRLGRWTQAEGNWIKAERCYRKASASVAGITATAWAPP